MEAMAPAFVMAGSTELDIVFTSPIGLHSTLRPGLAVHLPDGGVATVVAVGADTDALSQSLRVRARAEHAGALVPGQQFEVALSLPPPEDAVEVPFADRESARHTAHALAVDEAVVDVAHRPTGQIAAHVPLRRSG